MSDQELEIERQKLDLERDKWSSELKLRQSELEHKRQELRHRRWTHPLALGLFAAAFGLIGNAVVAFLDGYFERETASVQAQAARDLSERESEFARELERQEAQSARVLETIRTGDPDTAAENLEFMLAIGLYDDEDGLLQAFLDQRQVGEGPALPASDGSPIGRTVFRGEEVRFIRDPSAAFPELVEFLDDWEARNIVEVYVPQLDGIEGGAAGRVLFNRVGTEQLLSAFEEVEARGLIDRITRWCGSYIPRTVRGSTARLSNHAFGTAFDINCAENWLGTQTPAVGEPGSVLELVPVFEAHGFEWGGNYRMPDPMHFQLADPAPP